MYSCEKLAKGRKSRFETQERSFNQYQNVQRFKRESSDKTRYEYNFADTRKYHVQIALYEDRPRSLIYRPRKK